MKGILALFLIVLGACSQTWHAPVDFISVPIKSGDYQIATYQRFGDPASPIHIYIEGDGNSFDARGWPTDDPTPHGTFLRDLAVADTNPNVVYMGRPCQYIKTPNCSRTDWGTGRFSEKIINSMSGAVSQIAKDRPVVLIGYSGGAMVSGLILERKPELNVQKWITIAGVLNHGDWTSFFGDVPLSGSLDLNALPQVSQVHFIAPRDKVVPNELSYKWLADKELVVVSGATHNKFPTSEIVF